MYSNGVRVSEVGKFNQEGYLTHSMWAPSGPGTTDLDTGKAMFRGQCMSCHTVDGYRSMKRFLDGRDAKAVGNILSMLRQNKADSPYHAYMPPLVGKDEEVAALQAYLLTLNQPSNPGAVARR